VFHSSIKEIYFFLSIKTEKKLTVFVITGTGSRNYHKTFFPLFFVHALRCLAVVFRTSESCTSIDIDDGRRRRRRRERELPKREGHLKEV
jgi:hypothetical protein